MFLELTIADVARPVKVSWPVDSYVRNKDNTATLVTSLAGQVYSVVEPPTEIEALVRANGGSTT